METSDPVGLRGQPTETLEAVRAGLKTFDLGHSEVILVTDWQDSRGDARYTLFVRDGDRALLSEDAFGPRYGPAGTEALRALVRGLLDRGAVNFKERVLPPHEFSRALEEVSPGLPRELNAGANPADPQIYLE